MTCIIRPRCNTKPVVYGSSGVFHIHNISSSLSLAPAKSHLLPSIVLSVNSFPSPPPSCSCKFYSVPTFVVHIYFYSKNLFSPFHCFVIYILVIKCIFPYPFGRIERILKIAKYIFSENHQVEKLTTKK